MSALVIVATAPVFVGGVLMGAALDRFERRRFLALVNAVLGAAVLSVPFAATRGVVTSAHLFAVAGLYGFLKMANWAGVPSIVPALVVDPDDLATANAMESVSFGIADIAGPAVAGVLIAMIGATSVLGIDAASYLIFVIMLLSLPSQTVPPRAHGEHGLRLRPAFRFIRRDRAVFATTVMFMCANIGEGMMIVVIPVYAREVLGGGAGTYGLLLSAFALATTAGAALVGAMTWRRPLGRSIAASQTLFGLSYVPLVALPALAPALGVLVIAGVVGITAHDLGADPPDAADPRRDAWTGVRALANADAIDAADRWRAGRCADPHRRASLDARRGRCRYRPSGRDRPDALVARDERGSGGCMTDPVVDLTAPARLPRRCRTSSRSP